MKTKTLTAALVTALLVFLMLPTFALAQTTTGPVPAQPPACKPELFSEGTGKFFSFGLTSEGTLVAMWACPTATPGQWKLEGFHWSPNYIPVLPSIATIIRTGDLFDAMWASNVMSNLPYTQAIIDTERNVEAQILAKLPKWSVAPNGTYPTRPVYTLTAGVLAATSLRVDVLTDGKPTPCSCDVASTPPDRSPRYCAIPQPAGTVPPRVAVCKLQ